MNLCEASTFHAGTSRMVQCSYEDGHDAAVPHAVMVDGIEVVWEGAGAQEPMGIISELVHFVTGRPDLEESPAVVCETHPEGAFLFVYVAVDSMLGLRAMAKHDAKGSPGTWHLSAECGRQQRRR